MLGIICVSVHWYAYISTHCTRVSAAVEDEEHPLTLVSVSVSSVSLEWTVYTDCIGTCCSLYTPHIHKHCPTTFSYRLCTTTRSCSSLAAYASSVLHCVAS